jgi:hypothetical protein
MMMCKTSKKPSKGAARKTCSSEKQFPGKLHDMLTYVEQEGLEHIVSWIHDGYGFMVHDPEKIVEILPIFFSQTQYRSFSRQLNMWHFERVFDGSCKGAFVHPYFLRGQKLLCGEMSRHHKLPLTSYPIKSEQLEAPWHFTNGNGESLVDYPSRAASRSPSPVYSASDPLLHSSSAMRLPSSTDDVLDSDRKIRAKKGEQGEFRDGALTRFAGRQFYFLDIDDSPTTSTPSERILVGPRRGGLVPQNQEEPLRTGFQDSFSHMQEQYRRSLPQQNDRFFLSLKGNLQHQR